MREWGMSDLVFSIYRVTNTLSGSVYIGITKQPINKRLSGHLSCVKRGTKRKFYDAIRSYGWNSFSVSVLITGLPKSLACLLEIALISNASKYGLNLYNIAPGGEGGFAITDIQEWKNKLALARKGKKPALGMKHTQENKRLFSEASKRRWSRVMCYPKDAIVKLSLKQAQQQYGISQTHYYRLRNEVLCRET